MAFYRFRPFRVKKKKKRNRIDRQHFNLGRKLKESVNHEVDSDTNSGGSVSNGPQKLAKETVRREDQSKRRDPLDYIIFENGQYTQVNPIDNRRLAVSQTPVKDHQLTMVLKKISKK